MAQIALVGHNHTCPLHTGGPIISGNASCTVNGTPVALVGNKCSCTYGKLDTIVTGHSSMSINGVPVATTDSVTTHGGKILQGNHALTILS